MTEQHDIITTFSEMAPRYESLMNNELNKFWGIDYQEFVSRLLKDFKSDNKDLILDIATGTAYIPTFLNLQKLKFKKVIGLDLTFEMLMNAKKNLEEISETGHIPLLCASAHHMPFHYGSFDQAICCLATHHMDAEKLLKNIYFCLKTGGRLHIADAGGSSKWKNQFIRFFIKIVAFFYFTFTENLSRGSAESAAIGNIHSIEEWEELIEKNGFIDIQIQKMRSRRFWAPDPIIIKAIKQF